MASRRRRLYHAITKIALPTTAGVAAAFAVLPVAAVQAQTIGANLKVLSPRSGDALGASAFSLDVSFHSVSTSAPVTTAELWVDGVRWVRRDLDTPQVKNVLSFAVDASTLSEGQHTLLVRVLCSNGSVGEVVLPITAGSDAGEVAGSPNGPDLTFKTPNNGRRVMGRVDLLVDSPAKQGTNPFVTIYVDKQFKTLMNMPPYTYSWDTTNVPNGFHTIEATGYLESSNQSTTRRIRVLVDNIGGNTEFKKEIPDLSTAGRAEHASAARSLALPLVAQPGVAALSTKNHAHRSRKHIATVAEVMASPVSAVPPVFATQIAEDWSNHGIAARAVSRIDSSPSQDETAPSSSTFHHVRTLAGFGKTDTVTANHVATVGLNTYDLPLSFAPLAASSISPSQAMSAAGHTSSVDVAGIAPLPTSHTSASPKLVLRFAAPRQLSAIHLLSASPVAIGSHVALSDLQAGTAPVAKEGQPHHGSHALRSSHAGLRSVVRPDSTGMLNASSGTRVVSTKATTVAFNGQQIAFDVQPRVEAGLPLAPFRQIFEHTGGQVDWAPQAQIVHAVNSDREIVITVGQTKASVNGESVTMERAAFVEKGRTIVPLSFVGAALNVKVSYDPATGRLQITSK